jgi:hypothetical protein
VEYQGRRAVAAITRLADGGIALVPLYPQIAPLGFELLEVPADYSRRGSFVIPRTSLYRQYRSVHGVKLSLHFRGFVQLSRRDSQGIVSGRDPETGVPRGFGFQSFPLDNPPRSGPTFALIAWGLSDYPEGNARGEDLTVHPSDIYAQWPDERRARNTLAFEFWVLARTALRHGRLRGDHMVLAGRHSHYPGTGFEFIVVDIDSPFYVLGLVATAFQGRWARPSGVSLHSPSDRRMSRTLWAISSPLPTTELPSADYLPSAPSLPAVPLVLRPSFPVGKAGTGRLWGKPRDGEVHLVQASAEA